MASCPVTCRDYHADPTLLPRVLPLLDAAFPGFAGRESLARRHGLRWEDCSTPFVEEEGGSVVAHVGLLALPLVVEGRRIVAGGLHAVATRSDRRGRGLARALLAEAVAEGRRRHETLLLCASVPGLYREAGFRVVPESRFVLDAPPPAGRDEWRPLDCDDPADLARLHRLLDERAPVSGRLGVVAERDVFLFDAARSPLACFPDLDLVAWMARDGTTLRIHDLLAREVPSLPELVGRIAGPIDRVEVAFTPDRLGAGFVPAPTEPDDLLMALGPFVDEGAEVRLAEGGRC
jgi:predicted N-acetyltransferase YhbS